MCCRSSAGVPYQDPGGRFLSLRRGKPCTVGFCDGAVSGLRVGAAGAELQAHAAPPPVQGKCMKQVQDMVERLDISTLGRFLVAFSLLFWVPLSILVHCVVGPFAGVPQGSELGPSLTPVPFVLSRTRSRTNSLSRTPGPFCSPARVPSAAAHDSRSVCVCVWNRSIWFKWSS